MDKPFYSIISMKRKEFSHEQEVRFISHYKYQDDEDVKQHIKAFLLIYGKETGLLGQETGESKIQDKIHKAIKLLNANDIQKTQNISIKPANKFVHSVLLNPNASSWLNQTLEVARVTA